MRVRSERIAAFHDYLEDNQDRVDRATEDFQRRFKGVVDGGPYVTPTDWRNR